MVQIIQALLVEGVFVSETRARKEFPNLFSKSVVSAPAKGNGSPENPIKIENEGISDNPGHQGQDAFSSTHLWVPLIWKSHRLTRVGHARTSSIEGARAPITPQPLRFPYETQHHILSAIQKILEESCFNFSRKWLPSVLERHGWVCAEAGELTDWLNILKRHAQELPMGCISPEGQALLKKIAPSVAQLRHTVVHRIYLTLEEFLAQIRSARLLMEILQDVRSVSTLKTLYERVDTQVKKMEHDIVVARQEVDDELVQIRRQREALDLRKQQLLSYAEQLNTDIPTAMGSALLHSIDHVLARDKPNIIEEKKIVGGHDRTAADTCAVVFEDDDIESDEELLRAELG